MSHSKAVKPGLSRSVSVGSPYLQARSSTPSSSNKKQVVASTPLNGNTPTKLEGDISAISKETGNALKIKASLGPQLGKIKKATDLKVVRSLALDGVNSANSTSRVPSKSDTEEIDPHLIFMLSQQLFNLREIESQKHKEILEEADAQLTQLAELVSQEAETAQELERRVTLWETHVDVAKALEEKLPIVRESTEILSELVPLLQETAKRVEQGLGTLKLENIEPVQDKDLTALSQLVDDFEITLDHNKEQIMNQCIFNGIVIEQHIKYQKQLVKRAGYLLDQSCAALHEEFSLSALNTNRAPKKLADLDF